MRSTPSPTTSSARGTSASDITTDRITDVSGHDRHGTTTNMPTRAVAGHDFSGDETDWRRRPGEYGAIHFHRDDLEDAGWEADFELTIPDRPAERRSTPPGSRPTTTRTTCRSPSVRRAGPAASRIAVLMSTVTYVTYANFTDIGRDAWREGAYTGDAIAQPFADPTLFQDAYGYVAEHSLYGTYDIHEDGSGVCYGSMLRPILNMRPKFRYRTLAAPAALPGGPLPGRLARAEGHRGRLPDRPRPPGRGRRPPPAVHGRGVELASRVLDVGDARRPRGLPRRRRPVHVPRREQPVRGRERRPGQAAHAGGPALGHAAGRTRCRRRNATTVMTGELGGTWRNRGRGAARPGRAGHGAAPGSTAARRTGGNPTVEDPRVAFIFEGIDGRTDRRRAEPPGPLGRSRLRVRPGRRRARHRRRRPSASRRRSRFNASHRSMVDDEMYFMQGRDGAAVGDPAGPRRAAPLRPRGHGLPRVPERRRGLLRRFDLLARQPVRATTTTGRSRAVTENVLRRFADPDWRRPEP